MNKIIQSFLVVIVALNLVSCSSSSKKMQIALNVGDNHTAILAFGDFTQAATGGSGTGTITYESSNQAVATVDTNTGEVTPLSSGTVTITATKEGDDTYTPISNEYTVNVVDKPSLKVTFNDIKTFTFSWPNIKTDSYQLLEDSDGSGDFSQVGTNILKGETSFNLVVPLYKRVNASYKIRVCKDSSTCVESDSIDINVNNLVSNIGYFKASNTDKGDNFGFSVSLSDDGNTLAVGALSEDSNARGINQDQTDNSASRSGAVYIFTRTGATWTQEAYIKASNTDENDNFGFSVSLSDDGNTLAVGAPNENSNANDVGGDQDNNDAANSGAVYIFTRTGATWTQEAYIKASNTDENDNFGNSVSLSDDGNTLAVGAPNENSNAEGVGGDQDNNDAANSGAVYIFTRTGATWTQEAYIKASNTDENDNFGNSVSLSDDGNTLAVGAPYEDSNANDVGGDQDNNDAVNSGAVYIFTRTGATWTQEAYIKASNTKGDDNFGNSVSLSDDGNTLAVGAISQRSGANNSISEAGAAYVFIRTGASWAEETYIYASNIGMGDYFGFKVSLSGNGNTLAVGALSEDSNARGINQDQTDNSASRSGAVYIFTRTGATWTQEAYIKTSNTEQNDDSSICSLSGDGNTLAVGALSEDSNANDVGGDQDNNDAVNSGAVYLY